MLIRIIFDLVIIHGFTQPSRGHGQEFLDETHLSDDPIRQFSEWLVEADETSIMNQTLLSRIPRPRAAPPLFENLSKDGNLAMTTL